MSPKYSIVVTCKGRLHHLLESLPHFLEQNNTQVIVVDYSCPDRTAEVIKSKFDGVTVVEVTDEPEFNVCRARNIGAKSATGEYLVFLDADVIIEDDLMETVDPHIKENAFHMFPGSGDIEKVGIHGSCIVHKKIFETAGCYDEAMRGYGGEDKDLYYRFILSNIKQVILDDTVIRRVIQHKDEERLRYTRINATDKFRHMMYNSTYRQLKNMVMGILGIVDLDYEIREKIYQGVLSNFSDAEKTGHVETINFELKLPPDNTVLDFEEWEFSRIVALQVIPKRSGSH